MRKLITIVLIFVALVVQAQSLPKFELTKDGVQPIVVKVDSMTASQLYKRSLNWTKFYFSKNHHHVFMVVWGEIDVVKAQIEDELIRIENAIRRSGRDDQYTFLIQFKDNKMLLTFLWADKLIWTEKRKLRIDEFMNDTVESLYSYVKGKKKDDW